MKDSEGKEQRKGRGAQCAPMIDMQSPEAAGPWEGMEATGITVISMEYNRSQQEMIDG